MRLFRTIFIITLITEFCIANAAPLENTPSPLESFPDAPVSKSRAIAEAKHIQQECARILTLIPRLSPAEDAWLQGEKDSTSVDRLEKLMRSPEYARHSLYVHFNDCIVQSELAANSPTDREQTIAWARLAWRFSISIDLHYWVDHAGTEELRDSVNKFAAWERLNTSQIIDSIVIQYLTHLKE